MFRMRQSHGLVDRTALTRRQVLHLLGLAAIAAGARPLRLGAQGPSFPKGTVIRALLRDHSPDEFDRMLGEGAARAKSLAQR